MLIETNNLSLIFNLESDTVMDFVPITARYCQRFTVPITVPMTFDYSRYRYGTCSFITVPVTVTVPVALLLFSLLLPYFYYHCRSHFRVQFNESDVS